MKKLPIGIQTFEKIRDGDYVYVDKTAFVHRLITEGSVYFLSRPRRFGKSLLVSTLKAVFQGKKELFKGLAIENLPWDWRPLPVLHLDFSSMQYGRIEDVDEVVSYTLAGFARYNGLQDSPAASPSLRLRHLLDQLPKGVRTAILIDEYDKPILDTLVNPVLCREIKDRLKGFYTAIKAADEFLQFVLLTGVSKFAKISVFSGLNNLKDLTMHPGYAALCGYTEDEIDRYFGDEVAALSQQLSQSNLAVRSTIREWYNGFRFSGDECRVYNPISFMMLLDTGHFSSYWFETATPTFLVDLIRSGGFDLPSLESMTLDESAFGTYDIERLRPEPLLVQTGYLTIKDYHPADGTYTLGYPNYEVRQAFLRALTEAYTDLGTGLSWATVVRLQRAVESSDVDGFLGILRVFFARIDYDLHIRNEKYYQTIFYLVFALLGLRIKAEEKTADGRIDAVIETADTVFLFEFKLFDTAENALTQIRESEYSLKYRDCGKKIVLVGVSFDAETKNIGRWVVG
jgi:hypothetical protein